MLLLFCWWSWWWAVGLCDGPGVKGRWLPIPIPILKYQDHFTQRPRLGRGGARAREEEWAQSCRSAECRSAASRMDEGFLSAPAVGGDGQEKHWQRKLELGQIRSEQSRAEQDRTEPNTAGTRHCRERQ